MNKPHKSKIGPDGIHCYDGACWCWGGDDSTTTIGARTSNLVVWARDRVSKCQWWINAEQLNAFADEIERLQRELAKNADTHGWHGVEGIVKQRNEAMAERDRLRAALKNISKEDANGEGFFAKLAEKALRGADETTAGIAQPVEHDASNVDVAGSTPAARSKYGRGPRCPRCGSDNTSALTFDVDECAACGHEFTKTSCILCDQPWEAHEHKVNEFGRFDPRWPMKCPMQAENGNAGI